MNKVEKCVLLVAILASFVAGLDGAVVNVALPVIERELGGGLAVQQWVVDGYLLTLGSLILIAGSLSDLFGRVRILRLGLIWFGITSLLCAVAPNSTILALARLFQGAAGALLVPSSLALIADRMRDKNFAKAIGSWTAWTGIAFIIGPLLGGFFVDVLNWRWIFAINIAPIIFTLWLMSRLSEDKETAPRTKIDSLGALLCAIGLGGIVFALIEQARVGWGHVYIWLPFSIGIIAMYLFVWYEHYNKKPMLPLQLFAHRNFSAGNIATFLIYAGLAAAMFTLVLFLQQVAGYTATESGLSLIPVTLLLFVGSAKIGALSTRFGPRIFMTIGPLCAAAGLALIALQASSRASYLTQMLPGILLFGVGLTITVAPLTAAILGHLPRNQSGIASAVNNAVARIAGLLAVAVIGAIIAAQFHQAIDKQLKQQPSPTIQKALNEAKDRALQTRTTVSLSTAEQQQVKDILQTASVQSFQVSMTIIAVMVATGGLVSWIGIRNVVPAQER